MQYLQTYSSISGLLFLCLSSFHSSGRSVTTNGHTQKQRPNIIFILTDDHRWDAAGFAGNRIIQTPNLDVLAKRGTYFSNTYATTSISCVSRASILTGQQQMTHGISDFNKPLSDLQQASTYPMILKRYGYYVGFIGKYGVGADKYSPAGNFDYAYLSKGQDRYWKNNEIGKGKHLTQIQGDKAVEFLETRDLSKPFCLSISFKAPHCQDEMRTKGGDEFPCDPRDTLLYRDVRIPYPLTYSDTYYQKMPTWFQFDSLKMKENEGRVRWRYRFANEQMYEQTVKKYYRLISGVDRQVGVLMQTLKKLKLDDNTVIIFMGDNGFYLGEHGLAGKWFANEESVRLPLFIYDPRHIGGKKVSEIALNIDIAPTILDLAGIPVLDGMEGNSLLPFVNGMKQTEWRKDFYYEHTYNPKSVNIPCSESIIGSRYKLVRYYLGANEYYELFDLQIDPNETKNRIDDPGYEKVKEALIKRLRAAKVI